MTPVISDSWFVKGELLFHILEHDGFISTSTQRKYTEGSVRPRTKCPALFAKKTWVRFSVCGHLWECAYICRCVCLHVTIVITPVSTK